MAKITTQDLLNAINTSYVLDETVTLNDDALTIEIDWWGSTCTLDINWNTDSGYTRELTKNEVTVSKCDAILTTANNRCQVEQLYDIYEYMIPDFYTDYIEYGCADILTEEEVEAAQLFLSELPAQGGIWSQVEDLGFKQGDVSDINPSQTLACDMYLYEYLVRKEIAA